MKMFAKISFLFFLAFCLTACQSSKTDESRSNTSETASVPNYVEASNINVRLGVYYLGKKDYERAKQKFLAALEQNPQNASAYSAMGYYYETVSDTPNAKKYYLKAIGLAPNEGSVHNNYGRFLCNQKQYQPGINELLLATQDQSYLDAPLALENAGLCAMKIPNYASAKQHFQKALAQDPQRSVSAYQLALIEYQQGNYLAAKRYLADLVAFSIPSKEVAELGVKVAGKLNDSALARYYRGYLN